MSASLSIMLQVFIALTNDSLSSKCLGRAMIEAETVTKEFCNMESVNATCRVDEVLLIQRARYGRMQIGRCVKRKLGFLGCAVDVLSILDQRCSGRQKCNFIVPDPVLHNTKPCPEDTTPYLEVTYMCIKVSQTGVTPPPCKHNKPVILRASSGYISSSLTSLWNVGTQRCPWKISVSPGQQINMTIFNFNGLPDDALSNPEKHELRTRPDVCYEYAVLQEEGGKLERISMCGGEQRELRLPLTTKNEVTVTLVGANVLEDLGPFLLKYKAVGCKDLVVPKGGHVTRSGDNVTITCDNGHEVWYMTCKNTHWQGQMGNCSKGSTSASMFDQKSEFPFGILLVVAIGVALGVFLGGLLLVLAVIYMKRRHRRYEEDQYQTTDTLSPRHLYHPDHKAAMMINIHSDSSPHWEHHPKHLDTEDSLIRDASCRTCSMPYGAHTIALGPPPGDRAGNITGPGEVTSSDPASRQHIYECPKFS